MIILSTVPRVPDYGLSMNQYLTHKLQQWTILGAIPQALPLRDREGWLLTLCFRAKLSSVLSCLMLLGVAIGCVILQVYFPEPLTAERIVVLVLAPILATVAVSCVIFVFRYRVGLDAQGLDLFRFMTSTQHLDWRSVHSIEFKPSDELLKILRTTRRSSRSTCLLTDCPLYVAVWQSLHRSASIICALWVPMRPCSILYRPGVVA